MLVICEDCAKKYNIDESRIKGNRARFTCNECGHIIIVDKSDFSRPLIRSSRQHASLAPTSAQGKKMDAPCSPEEDKEKDPPAQHHPSDGENTEKPEPQIQKRGITITTYFLVAGVLSFLITTAGVALIIVEHYSKIARQQMELHTGLFVTSILVMLGAWALSFGILFVAGKLLSRSVNNLASAVNQVNRGEKEFKATIGGPREVTNVAQGISVLCAKIR